MEHPIEECTCTYGYSETAKRIALLSSDPDCVHCATYTEHGTKRSK